MNMYIIFLSGKFFSIQQGGAQSAQIHTVWLKDQVHSHVTDRKAPETEMQENPLRASFMSKDTGEKM